MKRPLLFAVMLGLASTQAFAQVTVSDAWIRGTVPGQTATGAFMTLRAAHATTLVGVSTPAAGSADVHEMKMEGNLMKMRPLAGGLPLPAGQAVVLKPGGYHIMLTDLKAPLKKGDTVTMTLKFEDAHKKIEQQQISVNVLDLTATGPASGSMKGMSGMGH